MLVVLVSPRVVCTHELASLLDVVLSYCGCKHLINLISVLLALEKGEKHRFKQFWRDKTFLVFYVFIQLLSEVIQDPIVEIKLVDSLDNLYDVLALPVLLELLF